MRAIQDITDPSDPRIAAYCQVREKDLVGRDDGWDVVLAGDVCYERDMADAVVEWLAGLAQKGATGGFSLAVASGQISLRDIYRAVEPNPSHGLAHFAPNTKCPVGAKNHSMLQNSFDKAHHSMEAEHAYGTLAHVDAQLHSVCPGTK